MTWNEKKETHFLEKKNEWKETSGLNADKKNKSGRKT